MISTIISKLSKCLQFRKSNMSYSNSALEEQEQKDYFQWESQLLSPLNQLDYSTRKQGLHQYIDKWDQFSNERALRVRGQERYYKPEQPDLRPYEVQLIIQKLLAEWRSKDTKLKVKDKSRGQELILTFIQVFDILYDAQETTEPRPFLIAFSDESLRKNLFTQLYNKLLELSRSKKILEQVQPKTEQNEKDLKFLQALHNLLNKPFLKNPGMIPQDLWPFRYYLTLCKLIQLLFDSFTNFHNIRLRQESDTDSSLCA